MVNVLVRSFVCMKECVSVFVRVSVWGIEAKTRSLFLRVCVSDHVWLNTKEREKQTVNNELADNRRVSLLWEGKKGRVEGDRFRCGCLSPCQSIYQYVVAASHVCQSCIIGIRWTLSKIVVDLSRSQITMVVPRSSPQGDMSLIFL